MSFQILKLKRMELNDRLIEDSLSEDEDSFEPAQKRMKLFDVRNLPIQEAGIDYKNQNDLLVNANLASLDELDTLDG